MTNHTPDELHPAFDWIRSHRINSLDLIVEEYSHKKTGAQHIHISANNNENVFLVALRTVPEDSTGVAHILEHTALCGSEKYPVRDPFFMMIRRSLNTFMNAFTSSDWTAYPFSSQNRKDFDNLLDVYLDAVFFSRLDPLDFAQEGHRLEFEEPNNPASNLVYKGVVFNEMKGAMSSAPSLLWQTMSRYLCPTTTYHFNSGGEPDCIPDLSYQQLLDFYKTHYHPSNAIFMTFGDILAIEHQDKFEDRVLNRFEKLDRTISVGNEKRYLAPIKIEEAYACQEEEHNPDKTHIVVGWLLGESINLETTLQAQLLSAVLLENSASPLQHALETTSLGSAPSPLCGLEDSQKELIFVAGVEGSKSEHNHAVENLILDAIRDVAENGVPARRLAACLHQLELQQREIGGDTYPYGLQLILTALNCATHRGDPIALLDIEPAIETLRQQIKDPEFIKGLAKELLLENMHRVCLTLQPDYSLAERKTAAEKQQLETIRQSLSDEEKETIIQQTQALQERQNANDDESVLPKVTLDDIPEEIDYPQQQSTDTSPPIDFFLAGTNGLAYQQHIIPLPPLSDEERALLPLYTNCLTELGVGELNYLEAQNLQSEVCGSISAYTSTRSHIDDLQKTLGYFVLSTKYLVNKHKDASALLQQTLQQVRFDEHSRIGEILTQMRARREMSVTGSGHSLAMLAAASGISPVALHSHQTGGLSGIKTLKALEKNSETNIAELAEKLSGIHNKIAANAGKFLLVGEEESMAELQNQLQTLWNNYSVNQTGSAFEISSISSKVMQFWKTNAQVNYCARAYPTVNSTHSDAAALTVLGGFLRNGFLHTAIREQGGAYGGGASQDSNSGAFRFFSYRDPRFEDTLNDFDKSIQWLLEEQHEWRQVEEAILGVISSLDNPSSPAGEAKQTYHNNLFGRTEDKQKAFRDSVLKVNLEDLLRVGETYLKTDQASTAVIGNPSVESIAKQQGLEIITL